jgi:hypothetical protein
MCNPCKQALSNAKHIAISVLMMTSEAAWTADLAVTAPFPNWSQPTQPAPVTLPGCSGSGVLIISSLDAWNQINNPAYNVFCVWPGNYTSYGPIRITQSGTPAQPKWIRWYFPTGPGDEVHPVNMTGNLRATIKQLTMDNADNWIVDRLTIAGSHSENGMVNGSDNVIWNRMLIENTTVNAVGIRTGASRSTIQNSVIRNTKPTPGIDVGCIFHENDTDTKILSNEIYNCASNALQQGSGSQGTIYVEGNDFYVTPALYCDSTTGRLDPNGSSAAAEDGYVLKGPYNGATVHIRYNRFWGFRHSADVCGSSSNNVPASGINLGSGNKYVSNVHIHHNIFEDIKSWGVYVANHVENFSITENIMYNIPTPIQNIYARNSRIEGNLTSLSAAKMFCYGRRQWTGPETRCVVDPLILSTPFLGNAK